MVAIGRALEFESKILILDEPTSSLDAGEVEQLFRVMRKLKAEGTPSLRDPLRRASLRRVGPDHGAPERRAGGEFETAGCTR